MPSSPRTPRHTRRPSSIEMLSPLTSYSPIMHSRRQSKASNPMPTTPSRQSFDGEMVDLGIFSSEGGALDNGLGNLADELANAWDEEDEDYPDMNFQKPPSKETTRDSGVDVADSPAHRRSLTKVLGLPSNGRGHRRKGSDYDGSDYGDESDLDSTGLTSGLVARMDAIESLARRGTEANGSDTDGAIQRVVDGLKELGPQSRVEGCATRLITAHTAISTHILHQTQIFYSLTSSILSPLSPPPDPEFIGGILPLLTFISESIPRPTTTALTSLTTLHSITTDVLSTFSYLSDTLHMCRQTTTTAARRLKLAKELVAEMKREEAEREEGEQWLSRGKWGERLEARECAGICDEVVSGFEEVCNTWRAKLVAQAEQ